MKKFFCCSLSLMFAFGLLFPVKSTADGRSPFIQEIKKIFHNSGDKVVKDSTPVSGAPIKGAQSSELLKSVKDVFHYTPDNKSISKAKKYPEKFDSTMEKNLGVPLSK